MAYTPVPDEGVVVVYFSFALVVQTFFFGAYTILILLSTRILLKRGLKSGAGKALFFIGLAMYFLTMAHWAYSMADVFARMQMYIFPETIPYYSRVIEPYNLFNALILLNITASDGIVVWRSSVICSRDHRKFLLLPVAFLILTTFAVTGTIALRIADLAAPGFAEGKAFVEVINILQVGGVGASLISNLSSTAVVGATAWRHRQSIQAAFQRQTNADRILMLLLESGLLYAISGITVIVSMLVHLPHGTLGDIYIPVNTQVAGAYAPIVLLLVRKQKSLNDTDFLGSGSSTLPSRDVHSPGQRPDAVSAIQFPVRPMRSSFVSGISSVLDAEFTRDVKANKLGDLEAGHPSP
ncbi:hypothetical protein C8F04DRAFT_939631 [Mycena alexandri]|uniref:Uncharacterized protein n=1 Tax=Mycena alexandri TaxID=1745969 RepID=A0AAD6THP9_9AGAR|nr:hypothetical protein C8F04DRAFT_939631 [Mycena alexandri]